MYIYDLFFNYDLKYMIWHKILILLIAFTILYFIIKNLISRFPGFNEKQEGFSLSSPFETKFGDQVYDSFYVNMHDKIHIPSKTNLPLLETIKKTTQPDENSIFLDINCSTGFRVNKLNNDGYPTFGIDASPEMINKCTSLYPIYSDPPSQFKCGNILDPMQYESDIFTHVLCLDMAIYKYPHDEKRQLMKNVYKWMKPGGYFVVHLVDKDKFDTTMPIVNSGFSIIPSKPIGESCKYNFGEITYISKFTSTEYGMKHVERFIDKSNHERENEIEYFMETSDSIYSIAKQCGFIPHGKIELPGISKEYQHLVFFERAL